MKNNATRFKKSSASAKVGDRGAAKLTIWLIYDCEIQINYPNYNVVSRSWVIYYPTSARHIIIWTEPISRAVFYNQIPKSLKMQHFIVTLKMSGKAQPAKLGLLDESSPNFC